MTHDDDDPFDDPDDGEARKSENDDGDAESSGAKSTNFADEDYIAFESAIIEAHDYALSRMPAADLAMGHINFHDYLVAYSQALWRKLPAASLERRLFYMASPPISRDFDTSARIGGIYKRHGLPPPEGIYGLPRWWGPAFVREMSEGWSEKDEALWRKVFEWSKVDMTQEGYLDLTYPFTLPMPDDVWLDVSDRLIQLHMRLDPGPFSTRTRFREFIVP
jgi:hypothetical protein